MVGAKSWFSFLVCVQSGHAFDQASAVLVVEFLGEGCFARLGRLFRCAAAGGRVSKSSSTPEDADMVDFEAAMK